MRDKVSRRNRRRALREETPIPEMASMRDPGGPSALCVVGGMPRGGTRNFADLANAHATVRLFGELQKNATRAAKKMSAMIANVHEQGNPRGVKFLQGRRPHIALTLLAMCAKNPQPFYGGHAASGGVLGFKKPKIERLFDEVDALLGALADRKVLYFCCRNLDQNYLSMHSLGWRENPEHYFRHIRKSLTAILEVSARSREGNGWLVRPLYLDAYIRAENPAGWLVENLYGPLGLDVSEDAAKSYIDRTENRNATSRKEGVVRRKQLTDEERREFEAATEIRELVERVNVDFGIDLKMLGDVRP